MEARFVEHRESELAVVRWRRFGQDRLYVNLPDGRRVGWLDARTGERHVEIAELRDAFEGAVAAYLFHPGKADSGTPHHGDTVGRRSGTAAPDETTESALGVDLEPPAAECAVERDAPWTDLAANRPGAAARGQAVAARKAAPVRTFVARVLGVHTDERAWRIGADGEEKVGAQLDRLGPEWRLLHALPVGARGSDIDHVVIGPGGVYTINAKNHPTAKVWVGGNTFLVNGVQQPYVRNSRHEAQRAARLLGTAVGFRVPVMALIAVVGAAGGLTIKTQPPDGLVHVLARRKLAAWLAARERTLGSEQIEALYAAARRSSTWRT